MANATANAIGRNKNFPIPGINASGESTKSVHRLATNSGIATSLAPKNAESCGSSPSERCRCVFSRQMIALSTSGPMARAIPASVMTLIVFPVNLRPITEAVMAIGIIKTAINVMRHSPRKRKITSEQRMAPRIPSWARL